MPKPVISTTIILLVIALCVAYILMRDVVWSAVDPSAEKPTTEDLVRSLYVNSGGDGRNCVFVLLYLDTCPHCPAALEQLQAHRAIAAGNQDDRAVFVPVNALQHLPLCDACGIEDVPHFMMLCPQSGHVLVHLNRTYHGH